MSNSLIVIENGQLNRYVLDNRLTWEVGRPSKGNQPDIKLYSATVSRHHGKFENMDGVWFYVDHNGKNGTVYNKKRITTGLNGRVKPMILSDGDEFVFGGGEEAVISPRTAWALFSNHVPEGRWNVIDTRNQTILVVSDEKTSTRYENPDKGTVIEKNHGMVIYMGDLTYLSGDVKVTLEKA